MDLVAHTRERLRATFGAGFATRRYLLAVSGGRDSMTLLDVFYRLLPAPSLVVAHFNHRTRPTASRDEALVGKRAAEYGIAYARAERTAPTGLSEEALREARRSFLERARLAYRADAIATGHHGDDQLETFLMRILRGSGLDGLGAMRDWQPPWLRPWLAVPRSAIAAVADEWRVPYFDDESNFGDHYLRNRLRRRLSTVVGELAAEFGGEARLFSRFAGQLRELQWAAGALGAETAARAARLLRETPFWWHCDRDFFFAEPAEWRWRLFRQIGAMHSARAGSPPPSREALARLDRELARGQRCAQIAGLTVRQSCRRLFFQTDAQAAARAGARFSFRCLDGRWECPDLGWRIELANAFAADPALEVRFFRAGDRVGKHKMKTLFLQNRIPQPERALLPLVALRGSPEILWHYGKQDERVSCHGPAFPLSSSSQEMTKSLS